jgi:DNA-binding MarR family transcriptional regulator
MLDKQSDVSRLVERLRLKGLLKRSSGTTGRRMCEVSITAKGLALLDKTDQKMASSYESLELLTAAEAEEANRILDKMRG